MSKIGGGVSARHPMLRRTGPIALVALFAIAWIQLAYAGHQFEHAAGDRTDTCSVCSHFGRLDHTVPMEFASPEVVVVHVFVEEPSAAPSRAPFERYYHSRAPPIVS